ncbi:hypothetical protein VTI74DRAFT_1467 [Chaetomium olivicolor]
MAKTPRRKWSPCRVDQIGRLYLCLCALQWQTHEPGTGGRDIPPPALWSFRLLSCLSLIFSHWQFTSLSMYPTMQHALVHSQHPLSAVVVSARSKEGKCLASMVVICNRVTSLTHPPSSGPSPGPLIYGGTITRRARPDLITSRKSRTPIMSGPPQQRYTPGFISLVPGLVAGKFLITDLAAALSRSRFGLPLPPLVRPRPG